MLARVEHLTSSQIADRIFATDLAVHLDGIGYYDRRGFSAVRRAEKPPTWVGDSTYKGQKS